MRRLTVLLLCTFPFLIEGCGADKIAAPKRSVLIISLDTFRPDYVNPEDMPFLTEFLKSARLFTAARTVVPLTLPSHASLFSGLLPSRMRVHDNVGSPVPPASDRDYSLLAEEFRDAGYRTGAVVASRVLQPRTGVSAGFDDVRGPRENADETADVGYRAASMQVALANRWLAKNDGRPEFFWLHFYDAHDPYLPFDGGLKRAATTTEDTPQDQYRGEMRRIDRWLEKLLENIPAETIVVLASDHGEGLGEHGEPTHGPLCYSSTIDQFLAVRGLEPGVDNKPRSICDVAPTLRAMCSLPNVKTDGSRLDGPAADAVVSESLLTWRLHGWAQVLTASDGRYTLIESGPDVRLFDRSVDPGELKPLDPSGHPAYERLDRALRRLRETSSDQSMDLEVLGSTTPYGSMRRPFSHYIPRAENAKLLDPEPRLVWWMHATAAQQHLTSAVARGDFLALEKLIEAIRKLAAESPMSPVPHQLLGQAYEALGGITKKPEDYQAGIDASIRSIQLGFVLPEIFTTGLQCAFQSKNAKGMQRLVELGVDTGLIPDVDAAHAFYSAAMRDDSLAKKSAVLLRRTRARGRSNSAIEEWITELAGE